MSDIVHEWNGSWWHWDETWCERYGPYPTRAAASLFSRRYSEICLGGRVWMPAGGEIVRATRNDLTTVIVEVVGRSPFTVGFRIRPLDGGAEYDVGLVTLDPISPLEALAAGVE